MIINVEILRTCRPLNIKQWAGHVLRRDGFRIPQKINGRFGVRRPVGKPRGRRDDPLESDAVFAPDRGREGGSKNERRLEKVNR
jgi:hypothetical protein